MCQQRLLMESQLVLVDASASSALLPWADRIALRTSAAKRERCKSALLSTSHLNLMCKFPVKSCGVGRQREQTFSRNGVGINQPIKCQIPLTFNQGVGLTGNKSDYSTVTLTNPQITTLFITTSPLLPPL